MFSGDRARDFGVVYIKNAHILTSINPDGFGLENEAPIIGVETTNMCGIWIICISIRYSPGYSGRYIVFPTG